MSGRWSAAIWQGGMVVARCYSEHESRVRLEASHYAMVYGQDGPVKVRIRRPRLTSPPTKGTPHDPE